MPSQEDSTSSYCYAEHLHGNQELLISQEKKIQYNSKSNNNNNYGSMSVYYEPSSLL